MSSNSIARKLSDPLLEILTAPVPVNVSRLSPRTSDLSNAARHALSTIRTTNNVLLLQYFRNNNQHGRSTGVWWRAFATFRREIELLLKEIEARGSGASSRAIVKTQASLHPQSRYARGRRRRRKTSQKSKRDFQARYQSAAIEAVSSRLYMWIETGLLDHWFL